ncbi:MAG: hypothetical protein ACK58L_16050, partial [Planctomycetota bacterium]
MTHLAKPSLQKGPETLARKASRPADASGQDSARHIALEGVRVHNLRGFNLKIRHQTLTVVCGVSGSGKSSLAFDTLYAEGQRRYIETFSPSARQFLDRIERPDVDRISGLPPAIAIRQQQRSEGLRSTLGTKTEILDHLRVLFSRLGTTVCPGCGSVVRPLSPETAAEEILRSFAGRLMILSRMIASEGQVLTTAGELAQAGFTRLVHHGRIRRLEEIDESELTDEYFVVIDRLRCEDASAKRLAEAIASAMSRSGGRCDLLVEQRTSGESQIISTVKVVDGSSWHSTAFSSRRVCLSCERQFPEPTPDHLSFNSPLGACPSCEGAGFVRVSPDARRGSGGSRGGRDRTSASMARGSVVCHTCHGSRLNDDAMSLRWDQQTIDDIAQLECVDVLMWLQKTMAAQPEVMRKALKPAFEHAVQRLQMLIDLGLGYLKLHRPLATLSGGELQRASLTIALASGLINTLYILDEPTAGLHPGDTSRVLDKIRALQGRGNTVVVVEHDPTVIGAADDVIEIGPGAGNDGGQLVFQGAPDVLLAAPTVTGRKLAELRTIEPRSASATGRRQGRKSASCAESGSSVPDRIPEHWMELRGVHCHNINNLSVRLPLGVFCVVVGVSGSGKSSLIA